MATIGPHDPAVYEQVQARALDLIRSRKIWFLYVVDDEFEGEYLMAAPDIGGDVDGLPQDVLARVLLRAARSTVDELLEALDG